MKRNPTRRELRNACLDAHDFITTNMNGADDDCMEQHKETMEILSQFFRTGKLARTESPKP